MKFILALAGVLFIGSASFGQGMFSRLYKPNYTFAQYPSAKSAHANAAVVPDSIAISAPTMQAFRFVANAATYAEPNHIAMAGMGVSYQWLKYNATSQTWVSTLSVNGLLYGGGSVTPPNTAVYGAGLSVGVLNNAITLGGAYIIPTHSVVFTIGANININNN